MAAELSNAGSQPPNRLKVTLRGAVQGVGFRPFVFRLATELGLKGWVNNSAQGVFVEVEGAHASLEHFLLRVEKEKPPRSFIQSLEATWLDAVGYTAFEIRPSEQGGAKTALVLPDIAACPECVAEIFDPKNRRYFYPFTNCTNCGPRFSIIQALPYDRANTTMKAFAMCPRCLAEYGDPQDRRFHAQPNACLVCGPQVALWDKAGANLSGPNPREILAEAASAIRAGRIVAVKGLGGFHLMVSAADEQAIRRLRSLKHREEKPFALMFPSLDAIEQVCEVEPFERRLLCSPEAPIVILRRKPQPNMTAAGPALSIAPGNPTLGVMLPYTPLHHLLMSLLASPVVATSGNLSDEPICIDEDEALERLTGVADLFLVHNRPISRHVDDSIVRILAGRELVIRRARGFAPLPFSLHGTAKRPARVLGVGAHLKNTIALSSGSLVFVSQHIGDLETDQAFEAFRRVVADLENLFEAEPELIAADAHPDYLSTRFAQDLVAVESRGGPGRPGSPNNTSCELLSVQHHFAHVLACMAENEIEPPLLGVAWDGTGYGLDGTVWGGEFFLITKELGRRAGYLRPFRLPGGDRAVREPRRSALGVLFEIFGTAAFTRTELAPLRVCSPAELRSLKTMLVRKINSPSTSSVGRLFDAVASLTGLRHEVRFEGQAAMELEFALEGIETDEAYPLPFRGSTPEAPDPGDSGGSHPAVLDWAEMIRAILDDCQNHASLALISARFHNALAEGIVSVARHFAQSKVALSGGCFQNRYLTERTIRRLREEGFQPYWHQRLPPNDGGISVGQVFAAVHQLSLRAALPLGT